MKLIPRPGLLRAAEGIPRLTGRSKQRPLLPELARCDFADPLARLERQLADLHREIARTGREVDLLVSAGTTTRMALG